MATDIPYLNPSDNDEDQKQKNSTPVDYGQLLDQLALTPEPVAPQAVAPASTEVKDIATRTAVPSTETTNPAPAIDDVQSLDGSKNPFLDILHSVQNKPDNASALGAIFGSKPYQDTLSSSDETVSTPDDTSVPKSIPQPMQSDKAGELQNLQGEQVQDIKQARLMKAFDLLGAGIAGHGAKPAAQELYDEQIKESGVPTAQFNQRQAFEKSDPSSAISKDFRQFMKDRFNIKLGDNIALDDGEKIAPWAAKAMEMDINKKLAMAQSKEKLQETIRHNKELEDLKGESLGSASDRAANKQKVAADKETTTRFDKAGKLLTSELASSRSTMGIDAKTIQGADTLKALLSSQKNLDDLDSRQAYEASRILDRMLSQGAPTEASSGKLTPDTAKSWLKKKIEFITNSRQGADLASFLKNTQDTADRERGVAMNRIKTAQGKLLAPYYDLKTKDPEKWKIMMNQHDLPEDLFDAPKSVSSPKVPANSPLAAVANQVKTINNSDGSKSTFIKYPGGGWQPMK